MADTKMNGGRFIAETLKGYGLTHVFYMEAMLRFASLEMEQLGIRRIITHSEKSAAYMADGYARASGRAGVCMAQSVGAANLAAGLQDAYLASSPVLALTGRKSPEFRQRNAYQELDHDPLYAAMTKFHADIRDTKQLPVMLRQAFREAVTGRPGPVHLDMPNHTGRVMERSGMEEVPVIEDIYTRVPPFRPAAEQSAVDRAAEVLDRAERPVIVAGGGVRISGAGEAVLALARRGGIPVVASVDGKAVIDESDPLWAGIVGAYSMECANRTVHRADLVLFIGSGTGDQVTLDWRLPTPGTEVIQIDISPAELGRNYPGALGLPGDARTVTKQLTEAIKQQERSAWREEVAGYVQDWYGGQRNYLESTATPIRPERLCAEISEALPDNGILVADTGYSAIWAATMVRMSSSQLFLRAAGSLGWAYPASLGAACGAPERPVICFTGDGAFYYHLAEMETAGRYGIPSVTVINNNQAYSQGIGDITRVHRESGSSLDPATMYRFKPVNLSRVAGEFGLEAFRVEDQKDLPETLRKAVGLRTPVVVEVLTDIDARAAEPWAP